MGACHCPSWPLLNVSADNPQTASAERGDLPAEVDERPVLEFPANRTPGRHADVAEGLVVAELAGERSRNRVLVR